MNRLEKLLFMTQAYFKKNFSNNNINDNHVYLIESPCIIESQTTANGWYRVWSDGWCEQGGEFVNASTITFLKPFIDTNYSISINYLDSTAATTISISYLAPRRTVNDFTLSSSSIKRCWKASGYIN